MQVGNENLSYSGTNKNGEEEWFESDLGGRVACTQGLIGLGGEEEDDVGKLRQDLEM